MLRSIIHFNLILCMMWLRIEIICMRRFICFFTIVEDYFFHLITLVSVLKSNPHCRCGSISRPTILFHWSIYLSLCQYYTVLINWQSILSHENREWVSFNLVFFFFFSYKIVLAILDPLHFYIKFRIGMSISIFRKTF